MSTFHFRDSRLFTGLSLDSTQHQDDSIMMNYQMEFGIANQQLRVGKYCMMAGFPCKIRQISRSAPGKHGHAKLRTVGVGLFDQRKRETIFGSQEQVLIPSVETRAVPCRRLSEEGEHVLRLSTRDSSVSEGLPLTISVDENFAVDGGSKTFSKEAGPYFVVSMIIACGHFHVTAIRTASMEEVDNNSLSEMKNPSAAGQHHQPVLSKKEQRKQRKLLKKKKQQGEAVPALVAAAPAPAVAAAVD